MTAQDPEPTDAQAVAPASAEPVAPPAVARSEVALQQVVPPVLAPIVPPLESPVESPGRRRFLRFLLSFSAVSTLAMITAPIVGFLIPPKTSAGAAGGKVLAGTTADIPAGTGTVVALGSKPVIVTNTDAGILAYSAVCTHLGCIVGFDTTTKHIVCPCHDGHFNPANGAVVSGPPPRPLAPVAVSVEKDQIFLVPGG